MLNLKFWEKYFEVYDNLVLLYPYKDLIGAIINNLDIEKNDKILDLGSGTGNIALEVEKMGAEVTGIDSSEIGIEIHRAKKPEAQIIKGDITEALPFPNNYFDKIYSNNVIYTLPEEKRGRVFRELNRVLKSGGIIVISNLLVGFKPFSVYKEHIRKELHQKGLVRTIIKVFSFLIPTIKMFYYNFLIKREHALGDYKFMSPRCQRKYLEEAGFVKVSDNILTYAKQAVLNKAYKK